MLGGLRVATVLDERTIRLDEEVARRLRLRPGERLEVRVRDGEVVLVVERGKGVVGPS